MTPRKTLILNLPNVTGLGFTEALQAVLVSGADLENGEFAFRNGTAGAPARRARRSRRPGREAPAHEMTGVACGTGLDGQGRLTRTKCCRRPRLVVCTAPQRWSDGGRRPLPPAADAAASPEPVPAAFGTEETSLR